MLKAYYTIGYDTTDLFNGMEISRLDPQLTNRGKFDVIYIDMVTFKSRMQYKQLRLNEEAVEKGGEPVALDWVRFLVKSLIQEIADMYGDDIVEDNLADTMVNAVEKTGRQFVWICDEWDNFFREPTDDPHARKNYIELLRSLFKDKEVSSAVFAAAYMTGILPMVKMKGYSALSEFDNYTMFYPKDLAPYIGFTEDEVKGLLRRNPGCGISYEEMAEWYEGYAFPAVGPIFNPRSVIEALDSQCCGPFWNETDSNEQFRQLVALDNDGLRSDVEMLLQGEGVPVDSDSFDNDLATLPAAGSDATLAAMVHLGYLSFDQKTRCAQIPNSEIREMYMNMLEDSTYQVIYRKIAEADGILESEL